MGSVSDAYYGFNPDTEGDAGPINRSVGFGPVDTINWLLPLTRLVVGREGAETSVRSGSQDEPLTPTNFTLKDCSTQGSSAVAAVKIDTRGVFVQQSGRRVYELAFSAEALDYTAHDLTRLNPDIGVVGITGVAVQRQPDTQLHFVRADGQIAALVHDAEDQVECWWRIDTDCGVGGAIESAVVLPGALENRVYYAVKRTIGGSSRRFLEKLALRHQCDGHPQARCADAHIIHEGGGTTVTGLSHLEGQGVVAWAWDDDSGAGNDCGTGVGPDGIMRTLTVAGGTIAIPSGFDKVCVGLPYEGRFKSAKLAYAAQMGTALNQKKKLNRIGLILADTHCQGLRFGQTFARMDNLPLVKDGVTVAPDTLHTDFDGPMTSLYATINGTTTSVPIFDYKPTEVTPLLNQNLGSASYKFGSMYPTNIIGTTTNNDAAVGAVGEYISSDIAPGSAISLTTAAAANVTSISLTAGDWNVEGSVTHVAASGTTITAEQGWISATSATLPTDSNGGGFFRTIFSIPSTGAQTLPTGCKRLTLSGTTTIYLSARAGFSGGAATAYGFIGARRVR